MLTEISRRQALAACLATLTSTKIAVAADGENSVPPSPSPTASAIGSKCSTAQQKQISPICVFTKPFNSLSFDELADRIAELGFDGIEAPVRKGGHVEPVDVADKLPRLVEALAKRDLKITVLTSDINDPSDPDTAKVLKVAAGLGVKRYRMKYLKYDLSKPVADQLDQWRPRFRDLAAMNRELGIQALYQNHAGGNTLGAPLWDLKQLLEDIDVTEIGVAYDIRHAVAEGGKSWPITFNMIRPHVDTVYVKDFVWEGKKLKNVPLGSGLIPGEFFSLLSASKFSGPISLHEEYLDHKKPELVPDHLAAIKKDLAQLKMWLKR